MTLGIYLPTLWVFSIGKEEMIFCTYLKSLFGIKSDDDLTLNIQQGSGG